MLVSPVPHQMLPYMNVGTLSRTELQLLNQLHCRRKRRHRTIFTDEQLEALENLFQETKYPDVGTREQLARKVHLREEKVEVGKGPSGGWEGLAVLPFMRGLLSSLWSCGHSKSIPEAATWRLLEGALCPGSGVEMRKGRGCSPLLLLVLGTAIACNFMWPGCPLATRRWPGVGGKRTFGHHRFVASLRNRSGLRTAEPNGDGRSGPLRRSRKTPRSGTRRPRKPRPRRGKRKVKAIWTRTADGRGPAGALA